MNPITTIRRSLGTAAVVGALALTVGAGDAQAATGTVGPHSTARASCGTVEVRASAPAIKAVNRTTSVDQQWVVAQPVLYKWNGTTWAKLSTYSAIIGLATDTASPTVWYDFVTRSQTNSSVMALMTTKGYYKLAYNYFWYTGNTVTGSDSLWATHTSPIGAVQPDCTR